MAFKFIKYWSLILGLGFMLLGIPSKGISQTNIDKAILNLKRLWLKDIEIGYKNKIYFNKQNGLIDWGSDDFQIPITAQIIYKFDSSFNPPENTLVFTFPSNYTSDLIKVFPELANKTVTLAFISKEACYEIIDAISTIRELFRPN